MVIRGFISRGLAFMPCRVSIPAIDVPRREIDFLIDTGAEVSLIHPFDSDRLELDARALTDDPRVERGSGVGGPASFLKTMARLEFISSDGLATMYRFPLGIAVPTAANQSFPSMLGMDFISNFQLTVSARDDLVTLDPRF